MTSDIALSRAAHVARARSYLRFTWSWRWHSGIGVLVLAPGPRFLWRRLGRAVQQEVVVRGDERVGCRHRVRVVHGPVLAGEGDEARVLAQAVLEVRADLP